MEQVNAWLAVGGAVVTVLAWLFRLEASVKNQADRHAEHVKHSVERHEAHLKRHDELKSDLSYIRQRIDQAPWVRHD